MKNIISFAAVAVFSLVISSTSIAQSNKCGAFRSEALRAASAVKVLERQVATIERQIERVINQTERQEDQLRVQVARAQELQTQLEQRADFNIVTGVVRFLFVSTRSVTSTLNNQSALRALKKRLKSREDNLVNRIDRLNSTAATTLNRHRARLASAEQKLARAEANYEAKQARFDACIAAS